MKPMIKAVVVTVSDSRRIEDDLSGDKLVELLEGFGAKVIERRIVSDDLTDLRNTLHVIAEREDVDLLITTGGTGFGPRDNTPEATRAVLDREAPGLAEAMRRETSTKTPLSMLSRAVCGSRGTTLLINLPGSPKAVEECFQVIKPVLKHAVELLKGRTLH